MKQVIKPVDHVNSSPRIENDYIFIFNFFPRDYMIKYYFLYILKRKLPKFLTF